MGAHEHRAHGQAAVACAVLTASDTRTRDTDTSGARARALLEAAGHRVVASAILPDDPARIRAWIEERLADPTVDVVVVNGGTGLAPRDTTFEAVAGLLEKRIDGFGELFRMLSYQEIGAAAMLSRAVAGVARGRVVVSVPGSTAAVELALAKLLVPELGHMVGLVRGAERAHEPPSGGHDPGR
jgi:molybdenum cofactor biosynthesis protein B